MKEKGVIRISLSTLIIFIAFILLIILVAVIVTNNNSNNIQNNVNQQNVVNQNENKISELKEFNFDILRLEENQKNIIYSPLSIKYALNMLNEGANGKTKEEITKVLNNQNLTKYQNIDNVLSLANGMYIKDSYANYISESYKETLKSKYDAEITFDEFKDATNVNKWIENKTLGIIKNTLTDNVVQNSQTLLINALAIDMEWKIGFESDKTKGKEFNLENGEKLNATTLHKKTSYNDAAYYKDDNITALSMDLKEYNNTQLEFLAIMPNKSSLSTYINGITTNDINSISKKMILASNTQHGLSIYIPKFSFDYELKLKEDLINLGIKDAFTPAADFSNMTTSSQGLYVSDAIHKANIDFTEEGIKAAAVTVFALKESVIVGDKNEPEIVSINKPFMYVIKDKNTDEIWFVGTVYEPNSWEKDKAEYTEYVF